MITKSLYTFNICSEITEWVRSIGRQYNTDTVTYGTLVNHLSDARASSYFIELGLFLVEQVCRADVYFISL